MGWEVADFEQPGDVWGRVENTVLQCLVSLDSAKCPFPLCPKKRHSLSHVAQDRKECGGREGLGFFVPVPRVLALKSKGRCWVQLPTQSGGVSEGLSRLCSASSPSRPNCSLPLPERRALSSKGLESDHGRVPLPVTWPHALWVSLPSGYGGGRCWSGGCF